MDVDKRIALYARCKSIDEYCVQRDLMCAHHARFDIVEICIRHMKMCKMLMNFYASPVAIPLFSVLYVVLMQCYCKMMSAPEVVEIASLLCGGIGCAFIHISSAICLDTIFFKIECMKLYDI